MFNQRVCFVLLIVVTHMKGKSLYFGNILIQLLLLIRKKIIIIHPFLFYRFMFVRARDEVGRVSRAYSSTLIYRVMCLLLFLPRL